MNEVTLQLKYLLQGTGYNTWSHFVVEALAPTVRMCISTSLFSITYHQWQYFPEHQLQQFELSPHPLHSELWGCVDCWPLGWYWPPLKQEQTWNNQEQQNMNKHVTIKNNNLVDFVSTLKVCEDWQLPGWYWQPLKQRILQDHKLPPELFLALWIKQMSTVDSHR